jgi:hypothetical protein
LRSGSAITGGDSPSRNWANVVLPSLVPLFLYFFVSLFLYRNSGVRGRR